MSRIRVLVVDDQTIVRQGIRGLLELSDEVDVVADAADGAEALLAIDEHAPDVVLLDLRMPRQDGISTLEQLRARGMNVPVLVLTTFDDADLVLGAIRAGARGYLLKDVTLERLVHSVRTVASGGTVLQPALTERLLRTPLPRVDDSGPPLGDLTEREREVLGLIAGGYSNREIAEMLHLAEGTVKNHVSHLLLKLDSRDRTQAVLRALQRGLLHRP